MAQSPNEKMKIWGGGKLDDDRTALLTPFKDSIDLAIELVLGELRGKECTKARPVIICRFPREIAKQIGLDLFQIHSIHVRMAGL